jgi:cell wall assembly regulator SMI1
MTFKIVESERATNDAELDAVETRLGLKFPNEYRSFLKKWNGGRPVPKVFSFTERGHVTESPIAWFFAVYDGQYENFEREYRTYKVIAKRLPENLIPIARDSFGNLICISSGGAENGSIVFWDHEREGKQADYENCSLIAGSLDDFLQGLHDIPMPKKL